jgi:hypothetical protein
VQISFDGHHAREKRGHDAVIFGISHAHGKRGHATQPVIFALTIDRGASPFLCY